MPEKTFKELCKYEFPPFADTQTNVFLASRKLSDEQKFQKLVMDKSLATEFYEIVESNLKLLAKKNNSNNIEVVDYDESARSENFQIECIDTDKDDAVSSKINLFSDNLPFDIFENEDEFVKNLKFYLVSIGEDILAFRHFSPKKELSRAKKFVIFHDGNTYSKLESNSFLFDEKLDYILYKKKLFIFNRQNFKWIFDYLEQLKTVALEAITVVNKQIPVSNLESLITDCKNNLMMQTKLHTISQRAYFSKLKMKDIKKNIEDFPELNVKIVKVGKKEHLEFDSKNKWNFLRVLDDSCVHSHMTGERYITSDKRQPKKKI
ncbi:MAG: Kiwa anti-phage protein KwaB-like domain-containing protein [Aridibacter sp.]